MKQLLGILLTALVLMTVPSMAAASAPPAATSTLYRGSFKTHRLTGWKGPGGAHWRVGTRGVVRFDGTGPGALTAPFSTGHHQNFAVEARIAVVGPVGTAGTGFGLAVRTLNPTDGIRGGEVYLGTGSYQGPQLLWGRDTVGGGAVTLHAGYNTYRLEVHGTDYRLLINGRSVVHFAIPDFVTGTRVGLWSTNQALAIQSFVVTTLAVAAAPALRPPVKEVNLQQGDLPVGLQAVTGHYLTNQELARLNHTTSSVVGASGLRLSYEIDYAAAPFPADGPFAAAGYTYAYRSVAGAQAGLAADWASFQQQWAGNSKFSAGSLNAVGDEGHVLSFEYTQGSGATQITATLVGIFFRRGSYEGVIIEDFVSGVQPLGQQVAATAALAQAVDAHIQHAPV